MCMLHSFQNYHVISSTENLNRLSRIHEPNIWLTAILLYAYIATRRDLHVAVYVHAISLHEGKLLRSIIPSFQLSRYNSSTSLSFFLVTFSLSLSLFISLSLSLVLFVSFLPSYNSMHVCIAGPNIRINSFLHIHVHSHLHCIHNKHACMYT